MGTSGGLNIGIYDDQGNYVVQHPDDSVDMPEGGNPSIAVKGDVIAVSGVYTNSTFDMSAGGSAHFGSSINVGSATPGSETGSIFSSELVS